MPHVRCGVLEEVFISIAQGIKSLFASARGGKTVLRALATTSKEILALAAIAGQAVALFDTEAEEFGFTLQVAQVLHGDIP